MQITPWMPRIPMITRPSRSWSGAGPGGTERSFARVDQDRNGVIQRRELIRFGPNPRFLDFTRRGMDLNRDNRLTRRDYHSPFGIRLLTLDF